VEDARSRLVRLLLSLALSSALAEERGQEGARRIDAGGLVDDEGVR